MIANYIKLAIKVLGRRKFFTFISLFGISLTLVVLMVAAAILDNLFAPREPESRLDRMLCVYSVRLRGPDASRISQPSYSFVDRYLRGLPGAERVAVFSDAQSVSIYEGGAKIDTTIKRTDGAYWQILDFRFLEGGPFTQADDDRANFVAVINEDLKRRLFGSAPAVGSALTVEGQTFRVIGVVPSVSMARFAAFSEIWVPIGTIPGDDYKKRMTGGFAGIVLAKSPGDFGALRAEFGKRLDRYVFDDPKQFNRIEAGLDTTYQAAARAMFPGDNVKGSRSLRLKLVLLALALLFITLPTLNLISVNLSRILERASEIGVRKAFGASSRTLVGQFVVENIVLTLIGGLGGFVLAVGAISWLNHIELVPYMTFHLNLRIFGYAVLLAAAFGVISGVYPAWRMSKLHPVDALRGGAR